MATQKGKTGGTNKFSLEKSRPDKIAGGTMYKATQEEFPCLQGLAIISVHLGPGEMREPHYHPNSHQLDYCVSGKAQVGIIGPSGFKQIHDLDPGEIAFIPQGYIHWFKNVGKAELHCLIILSTAAPETIIISEAVASIK